MSVTVTLEPLSATLIPRVRLIEVSASQEGFVASVEESLEDWRAEPDLKPLAIIADDTIVGFAMYEESLDDDGTVEFNIFRLMIDRRHQGQGYGRQTMEVLIARFLADPRPSRITTCFVPANSEARRFYASLGFREIETDDDGEIIAELDRSGR